MRLVTAHAAPVSDDASLTFHRSEMNAVPKPSSSPRRASSISLGRSLTAGAGQQVVAQFVQHASVNSTLPFVSAVPHLGDPAVDDAEHLDAGDLDVRRHRAECRPRFAPRGHGIDSTRDRRSKIIVARSRGV